MLNRIVESPNVASHQASPSEERITGYDVARAMAFLGMVLVNYWAIMDNTVSCPDWLIFFLDLIQGRAAATFVVLAGVGLSLLSKGLTLHHETAAIKTNRHRIWRRAIVLFIIGVLNGVIWPADILRFYALYFAVGAILVTFPNHRLVVLAVVPVFIFSLIMDILDFDLSWEQVPVSLHEWLNLPKVAGHLLFSGRYPFFPWISFLIMGVLLGRQNLSDIRLRRRLLLLGTAALVLSEFFSWIVFDIAPASVFGWETEAFLPWFTIDPWEPMPLFVISAGGTALIMIVSFVAWAERFRNARWLQPIVAIGQSTLTLYVAHIVVGEMGLKSLKSWNIDASLFPLWGGTLFFVLALAASSFWKRRFQKGPLEWLMLRILETPVPRRIMRFSYESFTHGRR
ncbi:MAG: DUF418 domain-containing protein [Deltaproteobacteria bacterium]|nr:DUF418 domain-containing protein [Deltaproteobacteria bacterium]